MRLPGGPIPLTLRQSAFAAILVLVVGLGIALVVGIDRIMSEGRALTNCIGNGVATMVIAKWQGELDEERCTVECPRHGSLFDLHTGKPMTLPAYVPIDTFPVRVEAGVVKVEVPRALA